MGIPGVCSSPAKRPIKASAPGVERRRRQLKASDRERAAHGVAAEAVALRSEQARERMGWAGASGPGLFGPAQQGRAPTRAFFPGPFTFTRFFYTILSLSFLRIFILPNFILYLFYYLY